MVLMNLPAGKTRGADIREQTYRWGRRKGVSSESSTDVFTLRMCAQSLNMPVFVTPWTVAHQAPLPMGFSRQEYWSG